MSALADEQKSVPEDVNRNRLASSSTPTADNHKKLADWILQHGGFIHQDLKIVHHANKGFHAVVQDGKTLPARTRIASCPMPAVLSVLNALSVAPFDHHGTKFPDQFLEAYTYATDVLQAFFLMEQYVLGSRSWWAVYLQTLPTVEDIDALQFESDEDVAWIRGTNLEAALDAQARRWNVQFEEANELLRRLSWEHAKNGAYHYKLFRWASTIFGSRSFTSQVLDDTKPADTARPMGKKEPGHQMLSKLFSARFAVLLPLLDILNHRPAALVEWQARTSYVGLQILEDYHSGQEVYNNYGPRDNEGLLMSYGFVIEDNPYEHVLISINAHPGTPLEIARTWPKDDRSNDNYNCYIFDIGHPIVEEAKFLERALFSYDLLDGISVMCSNDREFQAMHNRRQTLMSTALPHLFDDFRNILATLAQIMYDSSARAKRMQSTDPARQTPPVPARTQKQKYAHLYRKKQVEILQAAEGVYAFVLLNACTDQTVSDLLLSIQVKLPHTYSPQLEDICSRVSCLTSKNELFTAASLIELLPSPTANGVRSCLRNVENTVLESVPSHMRSHQDRVKTSYAVTLSGLCMTHRSETQLPSRLSTWLQELTSSYPPEDPNWNYVPSPGPWVPGEEPPPALMTLLESIPKVTARIASDSATRSWLDPQMICWAWNVMEEEGVRVPVEIERFASDGLAQVEGDFGFLMYCRKY
ncbi:hypothetical protein LTR70_002987 [Exophiala xenobiotica]|uniref:SET domain-containing protein n=1 Tax=Lithohypha guttulata TaxID=1690604 RepID=A0ABR0K5W1_9EURO|nr:hypothetical protein LTR24_006540 [Lithohypha guttulata]KAK5324357.1 hypothetical protein LTR70_002987 [Exophiala xenobiotica]